MATYIALLRAVNVGGTGKLPMTELLSMCADAGFAGARTHIASGNVVFASPLRERAVQRALESRLARRAGKPVTVAVRTAAELAAVLAKNPFKSAPANSTVAVFLDTPPSPDIIRSARGRTSEELALGTREIYVAYHGHMARSRLRLPGAENGTARNMNTIAKLVAMTSALEAQHK